jgi:hypothetical protein
MEHYECPDCGARSTSVTNECCDTCVLKFYFQNINASTLDEFVAEATPTA